MKKLPSIVLYATAILCLSACSSPSYFLPAITGNDISYLPKPMGSDSVKTKNYISGSLGALELPYNTGELNMGLLNFSRAHTTKHMNFAYGAFGFLGSTSYNKDQNDSSTPLGFDNKNFAGGGLRTSIGYYDESGNAEFRILSWENALSFESGNYATFRKQMRELANADVVSATKTTLFTTGAASEIIWHSKRNLDNHFAVRLFYGFTPGLNKSLESSKPGFESDGAAVDFAFYFKLKKFYGIFNTGGNKGFTSKFSLGYSF